MTLKAFTRSQLAAFNTKFEVLIPSASETLPKSGKQLLLPLHQKNLQDRPVALISPLGGK